MQRDIIAATKSRLTQKKHDIIARDIKPTDKDAGEIRHIDLSDRTYWKSDQIEMSEEIYFGAKSNVY